MGLKAAYDGLPFPWRKQALEKLVMADDGAGITAFVAAHPSAATWKGREAGADFYFFKAIAARKYKAATALLDAGMPLHSHSRNDTLPLVEVLRIRNVHDREATPEDIAFAEELVGRGASVTSVNGQNVPILGEAIGQRRVAAAKFLLENGADAKSAMFRLMFFTEKEDAPYQREILPLVLEKGGDPNTKNIWGKTPLFSAHDVETAKILLDAGADPEFAAETEGGNIMPWMAAKAPALRAFLKDAAEEQAHRRQMADPKHAAALAKKIETAVHDGVAVKPARKIVLKKTSAGAAL